MGKSKTLSEKQRSGRRQPRQDRSRKTYDALLDAAERLLKERAWEKISTVDIMAEAGCSNGAIYGRFKSKDDLLVGLYERHDAHLKERHRKWLATLEEEDLSFEEYFDREIDGLIRNLYENRWLLREMGFISRIRPEVVSESVREERKEILGQIVQSILRYRNRFRVDNPERAAELAVFCVSTVLREAILYKGPHFGTLGMSRNELKKTVRQLAFGYLGVR